MSEHGRRLLKSFRESRKTRHTKFLKIATSKIMKLSTDQFLGQVKKLGKAYRAYGDSDVKLNRAAVHFYALGLTDRTTRYKVAKFIKSVVDEQPLFGSGVHVTFMPLISQNYREREELKMMNRKLYYDTILLFSEMIESLTICTIPVINYCQFLFTILNELLEELNEDGLKIIIQVLLVNWKSMYVVLPEELSKFYVKIREKLISPPPEVTMQVRELLALAVELTAADFYFPESEVESFYSRRLEDFYKYLKERAARKVVDDRGGLKVMANGRKMERMEMFRANAEAFDRAEKYLAEFKKLVLDYVEEHPDE